MTSHSPEKIWKWFVIIKSHAIKQWVSLDILNLFKDHKITWFLNGIYLSEHIKNALLKIFVVDFKEIMITDNSNFFCDVYPCDIDKPHFKLLKKLYSWNNILVKLEYDWDQEELKNVLSSLKWRNTIIDKNWNTIIKWYWIRWHLMKPYEYISDEIFKNLSEEKNAEIVSSILNNYIHTTDTKDDFERLLKYF